MIKRPTKATYRQDLPRGGERQRLEKKKKERESELEVVQLYNYQRLWVYGRITAKVRRKTAGRLNIERNARFRGYWD